MSFLDDLFNSDGMGPIHSLIWIGLGIWAIIGLVISLPVKRKDEKIKELDTFDINGLQNFSPKENLQLIINHFDGTKDKISLKHTFNQNQIEWFKCGSAMNTIASIDNING